MTNRIREVVAALLFLGCLVTLTSAFNLPNRSPTLSSRSGALSAVAKPARQRTMLTLADRVRYQRAIEQIYWQHRIWPKQNARPKPSLNEVMPAEQIQKKVEQYLRDSEALEEYWHKPIAPEQLQAELDRIAQRTRQPAVLREIFEALGRDPFVIAECLARATLAERLTSDLAAQRKTEHSPLGQTKALRTMSMASVRRGSRSALVA